MQLHSKRPPPPSTSPICLNGWHKNITALKWFVGGKFDIPLFEVTTNSVKIDISTNSAIGATAKILMSVMAQGCLQVTCVPVVCFAIMHVFKWTAQSQWLNLTLVGPTCKFLYNYELYRQTAPSFFQSRVKFRLLTHVAANTRGSSYDISGDVRRVFHVVPKSPS